MKTLSVVIPALDERDNIADVIASVPMRGLEQLGYDVEVVVVDNGSTDGTGAAAVGAGARVVVEPDRGYGSAYMAGFASTNGDLIATADADLTYPLEILPFALQKLQDDGLDFLSTNRLDPGLPISMARSHVLGNRALTSLSRALFRAPFRDSQSGMWIFRRDVWQALQVTSKGMAFSQEIKIEAYRNGFRCGEMVIPYRPRGGAAKLRPVRDGCVNVRELFLQRLVPRIARTLDEALPDPAADVRGTGIEDVAS